MGTLPVPSGIAAALFGKTRRAVLALLFSHPDRRFHLRAIVRAAGAGVGSVQRDLAELVDARVIRRTEEGRQVYFQVDRSCPIYLELAGIVAKTVGLAEVVRTALEPLARRIRVALIYGSAARGTMTAGSDVDVLVIGNAPYARIADALGAAQAQLDREINPSVFTPAEWDERIRTREHFATRVSESPALFVIGNPGELAGMAGQRVAPRAPDQPLRGRQPPRRRGPGPR